MSQTMILSLIGGAASGLLSLLTVNVALRWMARRRSRGVDVETYYANMRALKRDLAQEGEPDSPKSSSALRLLVLNGILLAVIMTLVLLAILSFALEPFAAVPIVLAVWLALTFAPLVVGGLRRSRRIAILEIASVLERVARSESDPGEEWAISVVKKVLGGDLFGAEEEDRLDLRLLRLEVAPIVIKVSGRVTVAEAGLGRSVNKSGMRDLRLSGWFVNELRDTEVEFSREWGLSETSYAQIADALAGLIERLGFSLRAARLSQVEAGVAPASTTTELILEPAEAIVPAETTE